MIRKAGRGDAVCRAGSTIFRDCHATHGAPAVRNGARFQSNHMSWKPSGALTEPRRITFRGLEKPSGMRGQVVPGFAGGIAGRHCRHLPFAFGKAATHRASKPSALEACRIALAPCHIPEPRRKLLSKRFCSFVAPPRYDLRSADSSANDAYHDLRQARLRALVTQQCVKMHVLKLLISMATLS